MAVLRPDALPDAGVDARHPKKTCGCCGGRLEFQVLGNRVSRFGSFRRSSNDGNTAIIDIIGGQTRYIGKEMFGTTEYKVDDFRDKKGEITLEKGPTANGG